MPQTCKACRSERRDAIDQALLAGTPLRHIAQQFGTSPAALIRHREHVSKALARTHKAQELAQSGAVLEGVWVAQGRSERLYGAAEAILHKALDAADLRTALQAIRCAVDVMGEARGYLELQGAITGELAPTAMQAVVSVVMPRDD